MFICSTLSNFMHVLPMFWHVWTFNQSSCQAKLASQVEGDRERDRPRENEESERRKEGEREIDEEQGRGKGEGDKERGKEGTGGRKGEREQGSKEGVREGRKKGKGGKERFRKRERMNTESEWKKVSKFLPVPCSRRSSRSGHWKLGWAKLIEACKGGGGVR